MIRVTTRPPVSQKKAVILRLSAVLISIAASMLLMACIKLNPFTVFAQIFKGALGSSYRFRETVNKAVPLALMSLGICIAFKMKFWNIGAEGQFYLGGFGATLIYFAFPNLPGTILIPLMAISAFIFGGLFALIPAALKIKWGTSETLVTLMLNYIGQKFISYLQYGPWRDPEGSGFPQIKRFTANAILPKIGMLHIGWIITVLIAVLIYIMLKKTKFGYEISVLGESMNTARYAGINVKKTIILAVLLSGGICGLSGMIQTSAIENTLTENMSNGLGFTAVITTWLSALNPAVTLAVSFFFALLLQGGSYIQISLQVPQAIAQILQGLIIFFVLGSEFFIRYRFIIIKKEKPVEEAK